MKRNNCSQYLNLCNKTNKCTRMQLVHVLVLLRKFKYSFNSKIWSILRTVVQFRTTSRYLSRGINKTTKSLRQHGVPDKTPARHHRKKEKCGRWNQITLLLSASTAGVCRICHCRVQIYKGVIMEPQDTFRLGCGPESRKPFRNAFPCHVARLLFSGEK